MNVGVRELKARLSEYLRRAEGGEAFTVTERGRPKAVLGPLPGRLHLERGIEEGWIAPPTRRGLEPVRRHRSARRVLSTLAEDRGR
jgi:prevent-host-death family protein